jgi:hypothetical protein
MQVLSGGGCSWTSRAVAVRSQLNGTSAQFLEEIRFDADTLSQDVAFTV